MMSDEEATKSNSPSDSEEEPLSRYVSKEKETSPKFSAASCSVPSGNRQRQINIPTPEGTLSFFYTKIRGRERGRAQV